MPLPRLLPTLQSVNKRQRFNNKPSLNDVDDYCLSKIIGYALALSSQVDSRASFGDNGRTEMNLSLVSKRFYFLTQTQIPIYGVHRINLNKLSRANASADEKSLPTRSVSNIAYAPLARRNGVLMRKNFNSTNNLAVTSTTNQNHIANSSPYDIRFFHAIQPKLLKYNHLFLDGSLTCDNFLRLVVAIDAARIEQLGLRIKVDRFNKSQIKQLISLPKFLLHLDRLKLFWSNENDNNQSNYLIWTLFNRSVHLKSLDIHLEDFKLDRDIDFPEYHQELKGLITHQHLNKIIFKRSISSRLTLTTDNQSSAVCGYTNLIRNVLLREQSVLDVETDDGLLIEHLIKSSDRLCTTRKLKTLRFLTPIKDIELLKKLFSSPDLGTHSLSVAIDNIELIDAIRASLENFRQVRLNETAICQLNLFMKDQKFVDLEDKIKSLISLSRMAELVVHINSQQRVSIDCCHLMWSIGRALQLQMNNQTTFNHIAIVQCLFKITLQPSNLIGRVNPSCFTQITIPFGRWTSYNLDPKREDPVRHREIMRSLKRDCYHTFVKSVRDNIS